MTKIRAIKGMHDVLPSEAWRWRELEERFRSVVVRHGFGEIRTPIVEPTELFVRSIGEATDIVEKEMYTFVDKGEDSLTMRPEGTASTVRAFLEHQIASKEPVTKWFYLGPMYRRERPAKGRYRQFHQAGVEVYGDSGPFVDAEIIDMSVRFLDELGITKVEVLVNSLGSGDTRARYRDALVRYLTPHKDHLSEDSQRRLETNPLRILDSKVPKDMEIAAEAPKILDFLGPEDLAHWDGLRRTLDALGTPYQVDPRLVRGLDYYTRTLFEVKGDTGGAQNALLGGGRYDNMIEELGGPSTPAFGFALGIERLLLAMPVGDPARTLDVVILTANESLRGRAVVLARDLRSLGLRVEGDLRGTSLKSQFRRADKLGAPYVLILGESELERDVITCKELATSEQREVSIRRIGEELRERLRPAT